MKMKSLVLLILLTLTTVLGACQGGKEAEEPKNVATTVESPQKAEITVKAGEKRKKNGKMNRKKTEEKMINKCKNQKMVVGVGSSKQ